MLRRRGRIIVPEEALDSQAAKLFCHTARCIAAGNKRASTATTAFIQPVLRTGESRRVSIRPWYR